MSSTKISLPIIDISPLFEEGPAAESVAKAIHQACTTFGFFYISGHGISKKLQQDLEDLSRLFFDQPETEKMKINMALGGRAWRGYFPVGDELTSGIPDLKEGIYFGTELSADHPKVKAKLPMHGANQFPDDPLGFKTIVLEYMDAITALGKKLMEGLSLSLGLDANYFNQRYTSDPLTLFRIFHYPAPPEKPIYDNQWGVGEHTDYGVLTILKQDSIGGLQVKRRDSWIEAPYIPNTFICNIGDMLDRMTGGYYRSTPHRVRNLTQKSRFSFPFFFDPNFEAVVQAIDLSHLNLMQSKTEERWDGQNVHEFKGTYGDYILDKVARVFPQLNSKI